MRRLEISQRSKQPPHLMERHDLPPFTLYIYMMPSGIKVNRAASFVKTRHICISEDNLMHSTQKGVCSVRKAETLLIH